MHKNIRLHDIIGKITEILKIVFNIVGVHLSLEMFGRDTTCKNVEQSCLSSSRCPHYSRDLPCFEYPRHSFDELLLHHIFLTWRLKTLRLFLYHHRECDVFEHDINSLFSLLRITLYLLSYAFAIHMNSKHN